MFGSKWIHFELMTFFFDILLLNSCHSVKSLPNFVIFLADDLGYGDLGCFGNHSMRTPNIDKLAESGIKLTHHLTSAAVCTPSRAGFLTGRYPIRSGMESSNRNKVFFFVAASGGLPENETTFATALKKRGYSTGLIGKWHLGNDCNYKGDGCHHPLNHGFDYFYGLPLSNFKDFGDDGQSVITSYVPDFYLYITAIVLGGITFSYILYFKNKIAACFVCIILAIIPTLLGLFLLNLKTINGVLMRNMETIEQPIKLKGLTQRFVQESNSFILEQVSAKKPFLLYLPFVHVHTALFCSTEWEGRSHYGRYGDNVQEMDWAVGEIMKTLQKLNILNNTFVYFSSDNGAHLEETGADGQREGGFNGLFRGGKMMGGMEGGIRVPSIISLPATFSARNIHVTTSQLDLFPTIMELATIPLPTDRIIDGKSLVPVLKSAIAKHHRLLFHYCGKQIHAATYIPLSGSAIWKVHWVTPKFLPGTDRCKYVCHCFGDFVVHHDPPLLYNLSDDPSESHPVDVLSNRTYLEIISEINKLKIQHKASVEDVPDQFSFLNTVWRPWLQPCCNFPFCKCTDPNYTTPE